LLSGDLGYLDSGGMLYIVGRKKNMLKHAGETIAAQEVEEIAERVPHVRFSAAVGIDRGRVEGEQVYVFVEMRGPLARAEWEETVIEIVQAVHDRLGFRPGRVILLGPHGIPRTYNGKIQHALLKDQYLAGTLARQGLVLYPE